MKRRAVLSAIPALAFATRGFAASQTAYTQAAFNQAQAAGKAILVAVHASWCPICAKQKPIISGLIDKPDFKDLVILMVDFDTQKDVCATFGVSKQSTLIAFHGKTERDRSVGATDPTAIETLMHKTAA